LVLARNRQVHFVFVGEGTERESLMRRAVDMGLAGHVTWTGNLQDPFGEGAYAAADIVCQMSAGRKCLGFRSLKPWFAASQ